MNQKIDGKLVATQIRERIKDKMGTKQLTLGIISVGNDPITRSYLNIKKRTAERLGIGVVENQMDQNVSTDQVTAAVTWAAERFDGVVVQLPLPVSVDESVVLNSIPLSKDVDGLYGTYPEPRSPVALAVEEILERYVAGWVEQSIVVVGRGRLVGEPVIDMIFSRLRHTKNIPDVIDGDTDENVRDHLLGTADIVISGVGQPGLVTPDMIKEGVALIDAGTSSDNGELQGDIDPACYEKSSFYTPVPGGVGPVAVAKLFENLVDLHLDK